jgi:hypothetical protein
MSLPLRSFSLLALSATAAWAAPIRSLAVYPDQITLESRRDFHAFVAVATSTDDVSMDVTSKATITLADPSLAALEGRRLTPLKDGTTTMTVAWEGQTLNVPVTVKAAAEDRPVSFTLDVMPVFMRSGCNTGSCHGAARGQDGFQLSLFGFDPK